MVTFCFRTEGQLKQQFMHLLATGELSVQAGSTVEENSEEDVAEREPTLREKRLAKLRLIMGIFIKRMKNKMKILVTCCKYISFAPELRSLP